jgi:hypothetical protein
MKKVKKENIVNIHGKEYITVAGRMQLAHDATKKLSINTEVLPVPSQVVVKATVITDKGTFTGISAANPTKLIEKQSPYEVAETSAVGRALGFAGFGVIDSIATADEIVKVEDKDIFATNTHDECTCGTTNQFHAKDCPARKDISHTRVSQT